MWDNYPVAAAIGLTAWGLNRIGYGWGYWGYENPYYSDSGSYGYDYSEPLVIYAEAPATAAETVATEPVASETSLAQLQPTNDGLAAFEEARTAFRSGEYDAALSKLDTTLKTMPRDPVVHEFRSLVLFAQKKYPESAAAVYAVLASGPGWDWTTMISLYSGVDAYTKQVRELENFVRDNPNSPDGHFLLGYHYQTMGHAKSAAKQFQAAQKELPEDKLIQQLVAMTTPPEELKQQSVPAPPPVVPAEKVLSPDQLVGTWTASSRGATFELDLAKDGSFTWTYTRDKQKQSVKGVFAVDQNNLALETNDGGGTMLAEVDFAGPTQFKFRMIGDQSKDSGLEFKKS
jgi:tetratricopeptide (TPR) repeat protein